MLRKICLLEAMHIKYCAFFVIIFKSSFLDYVGLGMMTALLESFDLLNEKCGKVQQYYQETSCNLYCELES